jgi:1-acyl-sn-glycerol-3-phosphate acyltransferase
LVISNHTTDADPVFVGMSFPERLSFVASEHVFRMGFGSQLIRFLFDPIVFHKGAVDSAAIRVMIGRLKDGGNIGLFAEGNRSFSGVTGEIPEATGKLVRLAASTAGASLVTFRIRGGYFMQPRWGRRMRKGPVRGGPVALYTAKELLAMSGPDITALIARDIHEDAYASQKAGPRRYSAKRRAPGYGLAEHLETALYLCPSCAAAGRAQGGLASRGDTLRCACGLETRYDEYGGLTGGPFATVRDWWFWQMWETARIFERSKGFDVFVNDNGEVLYELRGGKVYKIGEGDISLRKSGLEIASHFFPLRDIISLAITGQKTLTFAARDGKQYESRNPSPRSAAKYQNFFNELRK